MPRHGGRLSKGKSSWVDANIFGLNSNQAIEDKVRQLKPDYKNKTLAIGKYRKLENPAMQSTGRENVFALLALVNLNAENGLIQFPGEKAEKQKNANMVEYTPISLDVGDALVWKGGIVNLIPEGGGGFFARIRFE